MNIFVSNLSFNVDDNDLRQIFEDYGEVTSAKVIKDRDTGRSRGFGFVEMPDKDASLKAVEELNQAEFDGKVINVNEAKPREAKPRGSFGGGGGGDRRSSGGSGGGDRRGGYSGGGSGGSGGGGKRW